MADITELVIDRAMWGKGALLADSLDYDRRNSSRGPVGSMCCLGWASAACGVPIKNMIGSALPHSDWPINTWLKLGEDRTIATLLNDGNLPDKEERLIELFASNGIKLSFTGKHW